MQISDECNMYRDGKYIVAPVEGARFPRRCIVTNLPVKATDVRATVNHYDGPPPSGLGGLAVKLAVEGTDKFFFQFGLSPGRKAWSRVSFFLGLLLAIVPGTYALVRVLSNESPVESVWEWILIGICFPVAIWGLFIHMKSRIPLSMIGYYDDQKQFIKLVGAGEEFLNSLPDVEQLAPGPKVMPRY